MSKQRSRKCRTRQFNKQNNARRNSRSSNLGIESLESRQLLTTLFVNSLTDVPVDLTDSIVTLRDAVHAANNDVAVSPGGSVGSGADTITFDAALTAAGDATINLSIFDTGLDGGPAATSEFGPTAFIIRAESGGNNDLTIEGPTGENGITIQRSSSNAFRLFHVQQGQSLTLKNLTLSNGSAMGGSVDDQHTGGAAAGMGGAIFNQGTLSIQDSLLTGNTAIGGNVEDVGLYSSAGASVGSTVSDSNRLGGGPNVASPGGNGGFGGGGGAAYASFSNIGQTGNGGFGGGGGGGFYDGNTPSNSRPGGNGGFGAGGGGGASGISNDPGASGFGAQPGSFTTPGAGAGMGGAVFNAGGTLTITNSTVSNNTANGGTGRFGVASGLGAGLFSRNGSVTTQSATFANNTVSNGNASGGAIFLVADGSGAADSMGTSITAQIDNTLFADSNGGSDARFVTLNTGTSTIAGANNIIESNDANALNIGLIAGNADPQLAPLADNGGPTRTHLIALTSPALNSGNSLAAQNAGLAVDQRGQNRFVEQVDVGAVELAGEASSLVVNTATDAVSAFDNVTSLREAITFANAQPGADTITFDPTVFATSQIITLAGSQLPTVTDSVFINGPGAKLLTINAGGTSRHFNADDGTSAMIDVTLRGMTLTGGMSADGGAIFNNEHMSLIASAVTNNTASSSGGGTSNAGSLDVIDSTLSGNVATNGNGGAIFSEGTLNVTASTLSGNMASSGSGGGLLSLTNLSGTTATITNSTFSDNTASSGGGIANVDGLMILQSSTITNNTASTGQGSGFSSIADLNVRTEVTSSIIAGNINEDVALLIGADNSFKSNGFNLIGSGAPFEAGNTIDFFNQPTDITAVSPQLGPLADNGGPTQTHALQPGSPALNSGSAVTPWDQRGIGFLRSVSGHDIGAFEQQTDRTFTVTTADDELDAADANFFTANALDVSLREAVAQSNLDPTTTDTIVFANGSGDAFEVGGLIRLTLGEIEITDGVTIDAGSSGPIVVNGDANDDDVHVIRASSFNGFPIEVSTEISDVIASGASLLDDNRRVFHVTSPTAATTMIGLTITGGRTGDPSENGGGILSEADLTLIRSDVSGNSTSNALSSGGGIASQAGLRIVDSMISQNITTGNGGGVQIGVGATSTILNSAFSGNQAQGFGGGIFALPESTVLATNATFSANQGNTGGALAGVLGSTLLLTNSTLSGNSSASGGAIFAENNSLTLANSIVLGNPSNDSEILLVGSTTQTVASPTIIGTQRVTSSGATTLGASVPDVAASVFAETIDYLNVNGDGIQQVGVEPMFSAGAVAGKPGFNGGLSPTIALKNDPSNPALDAGQDDRLNEAVVGLDLNHDGDTNDVINIDGRNGVRVAGLLVDLGAYELVALPQVESVVVDDGTIQRSMIRRLTVTFNVEGVALANSAFTARNITTNTDYVPMVDSAEVNGKTVATLTFNGAGIVGDSLPDGNYTLTVNKAAVTNGGTPMATDHTYNFYRYFGEINGDRAVLGTDFRAFVGTYRKSLGDPGYSANFDVNGDNAVLGTDFRAFVGNYRKSLAAPGSASPAVDPTVETAVESVQIDTGAGQRSMVREVHINFNSEISFEKSAFSVRDKDGNVAPFAIEDRKQAGKSIVALKFTDPDLIGGSLKDGEYTLTIDRTKVFRDDFVEMLDDYSLTFHRLFGDHDANRLVDEADQQFFDIVRELANDPSEEAPDLFDHDGDDDVDEVDLQAFTGVLGNSLRRVGDVNFDGNVGFDDFLVLSKNFGAVDAAWSDGDFDGDGQVGFADFLALSATFGN